MRELDLMPRSSAANEVLSITPQRAPRRTLGVHKVATELTPTASEEAQYSADLKRLVELSARNENHGMRAHTWPHPDCIEGARLEQAVWAYEYQYQYKEQSL